MNFNSSVSFCRFFLNATICRYFLIKKNTATPSAKRSKLLIVVIIFLNYTITYRSCRAKNNINIFTSRHDKLLRLIQFAVIELVKKGNRRSLFLSKRNFRQLLIIIINVQWRFFRHVDFNCVVQH